MALPHQITKCRQLNNHNLVQHVACPFVTILVSELCRTRADEIQWQTVKLLKTGMDTYMGQTITNGRHVYGEEALQAKKGKKKASKSEHKWATANQNKLSIILLELNLFMFSISGLRPQPLGHLVTTLGSMNDTRHVFQLFMLNKHDAGITSVVWLCSVKKMSDRAAALPKCVFTVQTFVYSKSAAVRCVLKVEIATRTACCESKVHSSLTYWAYSHRQ